MTGKAAKTSGAESGAESQSQGVGCYPASPFALTQTRHGKSTHRSFLQPLVDFVLLCSVDVGERGQREANSTLGGELVNFRIRRKLLVEVATWKCDDLEVTAGGILFVKRHHLSIVSLRLSSS